MRTFAPAEVLKFHFVLYDYYVQLGYHNKMC